ncbi:MAG TPA: type II toxin-antitoxin system HicA family toxin [Thermoanaerobaculia bacterium]
MKLPRDLGGEELARRLAVFGYEVMRRSGSHIRLTSTRMGTEHHVTIPAHRALKVGTLASVLKDVAAYLQIDKEALDREIFGART